MPLDDLALGLIHPPNVEVTVPLTHPIHLYSHFARYQAEVA